MVDDQIPLQGGGWVADYPDPHNFLRESSFYRVLQARGWRHPYLEQLLEEAAPPRILRRLANSSCRILVDEDAVVWPLAYEWAEE
jgi:ABC-type oligopeptide transport system substrate-binding subunit